MKKRILMSVLLATTVAVYASAAAVSVKAPVRGRVIEIHVKPQQTIKVGEPLFVMSQRHYEATKAPETAAEKAEEQQIDQDQTALQQQQQTYLDDFKEAEDGSYDKSQMQSLASTIAVDKQTLKTDQAKLEKLKEQTFGKGKFNHPPERVARMVIKAKTAGVVTHVAVTPGAVVMKDQVVLQVETQ